MPSSAPTLGKARANWVAVAALLRILPGGDLAGLDRLAARASQDLPGHARRSPGPIEIVRPRGGLIAQLASPGDLNLPLRLGLPLGGLTLHPLDGLAFPPLDALAPVAHHLSVDDQQLVAGSRMEPGIVEEFVGRSFPPVPDPRLAGDGSNQATVVGSTGFAGRCCRAMRSCSSFLTVCDFGTQTVTSDLIDSEPPASVVFRVSSRIFTRTKPARLVCSSCLKRCSASLLTISARFFA